MISIDETSGCSRVLLVNLNKYDQPYPVYPLGLAYVAGALRSHGLDTKTWDARIPGRTLEECIAAYKPNFIGLTLRNIDNVQCHNPKSFIYELLDCCKRVREVTRATLILGGSGFSVFPKELYELTKVDYGIEGEGEETLPRLIKSIISGSTFDGISGLHYRDNSGQPKHLPRNPSDAVFTAEPYHDPEIMKSYLAEGSLPGVQTQRGCPLKCCYCTYPLIEGKRSRYRTGAEVVAELRRMAELGVKYTFIVDSVFNTRPDHVRDVCNELIRAKLGIEWECFLRPSRLITREVLEMMRDAGLRHVEFGSDSFSDPVLKRYGKSFCYKEIEDVSRLAYDMKLNYSHFLIVGGPGETKETLEETIVRAQSLPGSYYFATIGMRVYPGTPLWREINPEKNGEVPGDYLVDPRFYLAPGFTVKDVYARLSQVRTQSHNWIIGDPPPDFLVTMDKLRRRGVRGPMWEYVELLQRFEAIQAAK
ncbi:MAG: lipid biosynthesis B12-binding/radical SAM protein [Nibricoccus sp.]